MNPATWANSHWYVWFASVQLGFVIAISYAYSRALLVALDVARDEQNRVAPQSPWYFFDSKFLPWGTALVIALIPMTLLEIVIWWLPHMRYFGQQGLGVYAIAANGQRWTGTALFFWGHVGLSGSIMTLLAPRFLRALPLTLIGSMYGMLAWSLLFWSMGPYFRWTWFEWYLPAPPMTRFVFFGALGVCGYLATWLYVRRKLDREWFRFDD